MFRRKRRKHRSDWQRAIEANHPNLLLGGQSIGPDSLMARNSAMITNSHGNGWMSAPYDSATVVTPRPCVELNNQGRILRFYLHGDRHTLGRDAEWSDLAIPKTGWEVLSRRQAVFKKDGEDYRIYSGDGQTPSRNGLFIDQRPIDATRGYLLRNGTQLEIGQNPLNKITLTYFTPINNLPELPSKRRLLFRETRDLPIELGRSPNYRHYTFLQLDSPTVSRLHARIQRTSGGHMLEDLSSNGTFVNGKRVNKQVQLREGNLIRIGPFTLLYRADGLEVLDPGDRIRLDVHRLKRQVLERQSAGKVLLDNISLAIEPGQLVALVGGSGTGKSTLMKALVGIEPSTAGGVFLNGDDLRRSWGIYRSQIGYVPQDDIVHLNLTVEEVLTFACKLRLPPDTNLARTIATTLDQIKLSHVSKTFVRNLSGGQRKRVSIGVELLADPKLFFLDEPTSGLDPGLDKEMMRLLKELTAQGRTVVLVTHATTNIAICDRVAFMGRGGRLCYFGPPQAALDFFEMPSHDLQYFPDVYLKLDNGDTPAQAEATAIAWCNRYQTSLDYRSYIATVLKPGKNSQITTDRSIHTGISPLRQLVLLSQRYLRLIQRDRISLALSLLAGPIAIALTAIVLYDKSPLRQPDLPDVTQASLALRVLFVFSCIAIWVGLSTSVREIVKEAAIYARERLINLGLMPYIGSKFFIQAGIAILQTLLIAIAILVGFQPPTEALISWPAGLFVTSLLTLLASISLSLTISAMVKSENEANNVLPLVMIPQIIFSGVLFELNSGVSSWLSWLTISRWSVGAYGTLADVNGMVPSAYQATKINALPSDMYEATLHNLTLNWSILGLHILVYLILTFWLQKRKDIF
jgi:ABC-type multidrug transport system ATPase subunit/ABC-type multidrug transport system permease subunit